MNNILIQFAHPVLEKSRVHKALFDAAKTVEGVTLNDLYELYPDFDIDVKREQKLLLNNQIIIWQHPFYWYSAPAILKQWQDLVLEHGWAYGKKGCALTGKKVFNAFSSGGGMEVYQHEGYQKFTVHELLRPFERTAAVCKMDYWPPYWIPSSHKLNNQEIDDYCEQFKQMLKKLRTIPINDDTMNGLLYMNDLVELKTSI